MKEDERCTFPLLRKALLAHVGAKGKTVAEQDESFGRITKSPEVPPRLFLYDKSGELVGSVPLDESNRLSFKTGLELKLMKTDKEGSEHYQFIRILKYPKP